jgi:hypothetical protein
MQSKIEGKFYPLQNEEWLSIAKKLTHSELLVLYHLRTLEPFGDKLTESSTKDVAEATGISQRSVQRALIKLAGLELIDLQIQKFAFKLRSQSQASDIDVATGMTVGDSAVASTSSVSPKSQRCRRKVKAVAEKSELSRSSCETFAASEFHGSKTSSDCYKTNQTLSEATRERNLAVWKNLEESDRREIRCYARSIAIPKLPIKPTLEENWIASHCDELSNQSQRDFEFQKSYYELQNSYRDKRSGNSPPVEKPVKHSPSAAVMGQCQCAQCNPVEEEVLW